MIDDKVSKRIIVNAATNKLTDEDYDLWRTDGHLMIHWLRNQFTKYEEEHPNVSRKKSNRTRSRA